MSRLPWENDQELLNLPPLTFKEAVAALDGVQDRDAIAQVVLRYARSRFKRAVLVTLRNVVLGWDGMGEGLTPSGRSFAAT